MTVSETEAEPREAIESIQDRLIDRVTSEQQEVLEAMQSTGEAVLEGVNSTRRSIADFLAERIRQDLDAQAALLRCRSMGEVREVQGRFLRTAVDQYAGEASRLLQLGREVAARSLARPHA